ncbi:MAG: signal peptidase II [Candidatus Eiseniibacteriota bacterium]
MRPPLPVLFGIAGAVVALDLWTKQWATRTLAGSPPMPIIGEFVRFTYVRNSGVAFGLGAGLPFPYYLFSIAAVLAILVLFVRRRVHGAGRRLALAFILGGALGNLVDRLSTGLVVDFIDVGWGRWHWPVFNVADSAVTIGVVMFALTWPRHEPAPEAAAAPDASPTPPVTPVDPTGPEEHHTEHDAGVGPHRPAARHGGAAGPLPRHGTDGPLA